MKSEPVGMRENKSGKFFPQYFTSGFGEIFLCRKLPAIRYMPSENNPQEANRAREEKKVHSDDTQPRFSALQSEAFATKPLEFQPLKTSLYDFETSHTSYRLHVLFVAISPHRN